MLLKTLCVGTRNLGGQPNHLSPFTWVHGGEIWGVGPTGEGKGSLSPTPRRSALPKVFSRRAVALLIHQSQEVMACFCTSLSITHNR